MSRQFDTDGSGEISYDEFMSYMLRDTLRRQAPKVMSFVKQWDLDGSGEVEKWEFRRAMGSMGVVAPSIAMIDALFDEMDAGPRRTRPDLRGAPPALHALRPPRRQPLSHPTS